MKLNLSITREIFFWGSTKHGEDAFAPINANFVLLLHPIDQVCTIISVGENNVRSPCMTDGVEVAAPPGFGTCFSTAFMNLKQGVRPRLPENPQKKEIEKRKVELNKKESKSQEILPCESRIEF